MMLYKTKSTMLRLLSLFLLAHVGRSDDINPGDCHWWCPLNGGSNCGIASGGVCYNWAGSTPTDPPTTNPTPAPSFAPSGSPTSTPSSEPTDAPTPTDPPTTNPTPAPSGSPTSTPSYEPTDAPTPLPPMNGGGGGDPHFRTWTGLRYDWHGECDLVFLQNPEFDNGRGMHIHIRTVRKGYYSYIERAALQLGNDILEFASSSEWYMNGVKASKKSKQKFGKYRLRVHSKAVSVRIDEKRKLKIDFTIRTNGFLYLTVDGKETDIFKGSLGMIGQWGSGKMIARDGTSVLVEPDDMAREWQVRGTDPRLFQAHREPQYPMVCRPPPKVIGDLRLGSSVMRRRAESVCKSGRAEEEVAECIYDVMATRDIGAAAF